VVGKATRTFLFFCRSFSLQQSHWIVTSEMALPGELKGGAIVVQFGKQLKRPYRAPSFEVLQINAAKARLETEAASTNAHIQKMLSAIRDQLDKRKPAW
jgi:hypothetical protein